MSDTTLQEEMDRCQWTPGDPCMFRMYGTGEAILAYVLNVDGRTRRLELMYGDGALTWQYMEWVFKT